MESLESDLVKVKMASNLSIARIADLEAEVLRLGEETATLTKGGKKPMLHVSRRQKDKSFSLFLR